MDVLSDVLRIVKLRSVVMFAVDSPTPWSIATPPAADVGRFLLPGSEHVFSFHLVAAGNIHYQLPGEQAQLAQRGDVLIFPHGDPHMLSTDPSLAPVLVGQVVPMVDPRELPVIVRLGDPQDAQPTVANDIAPASSAKVVCGFFGSDRRPFDSTFAGLPRVVHVRADTSPWHQAAVGFVMDESAQRSVGYSAVLERMGELLFIDAVRRHIDNLPSQGQGWLSAMADPMVSKALAAMHREPARPWTVSDVAEHIGTSRSVLAERFTDVLGESPIRYLTRWRLELAAAQLRQSTRSVSEIAYAVGYTSQAAFHRAFSRVFGATPGVWRRGPQAVATPAGEPQQHKPEPAV